MVDKKRRPDIGRIRRVDERKKSRKIKAFLGILLLIILVGLIILSLKYDLRTLFKDDKEEETTETPLVHKDSEEEIDYHRIKVELINGTGSNSIPDEVRKHLRKLDIRTINQNTMIMPIDVTTRILYCPGKEWDEYQLLSVSHRIKEKINLPSPRRVDIRFIVGRDISEIHKNALSNSNNSFPDRELNVEVLNGSGIEGAAGRISDLLKSYNYNVVSIRNAENFDYKKTSLQISPGMTDITTPLSEMFKIDGEYITDDLDDIIIIVGGDYGY